MMFKENGIVVPLLAVQSSIRKLLKIQDDNNIILSDIEYEHRSHHFRKKKHLSALRPHSSDIQRGVNKILDCSMTHMHYINSLLL
jgi:hypothetical protein